MPLKKAVKTGGAYLDLKELAADGPVLCVFRIKEFHDPEPATGFDGVNLPVIADVLICSGPGKGEVHSGERFIGAITNTLRGVNKPKDGDPLPPENSVGDEIVARVEVLYPGKKNSTAVGNVPSDVEMKAVEEFYQDGKAWEAGKTNGKAPATAGAGAGKPPW